MRGSRTLMHVAGLLLAVVALATACAQPDCPTDECLGSDGKCYGACVSGTFCTTTPAAIAASRPPAVSLAASATATGAAAAPEAPAPTGRAAARRSASR